MTIIKRAIQGLWNIPPHARQRAIEETVGVLDADDARHEDKLRAAQTLVLMDKADIDLEKIYAPQININVNIPELSDEEIDKQLRELETHMLPGGIVDAQTP